MLFSSGWICRFKERNLLAKKIAYRSARRALCIILLTICIGFGSQVRSEFDRRLIKHIGKSVCIKQLELFARGQEIQG